MKNLILLACLFVSTGLFASAVNPPVDKKVLKTFNLVFKGADNVSWTTSAKYSEASFELESVQTKAVFNESGKLVKTFRYYKQDKLPANIFYNIKKEYNFDVWGVTEVSNSTGTVYNVTMRGSTHWYIVKADADGNVELVKKFRRGEI